MNKEDYINKAKALGIDTEGLNVDQLKEAIKVKEDEAEREKLLAVASYFEIENAEALSNEELETIIKEKTTPSEVEKPEIVEKKKERKLPTFTYKDKEYTFSKSVPDTLKVLGTVYSLSELVENKEALEFLIVGNSCFVELKN